MESIEFLKNQLSILKEGDPCLSIKYEYKQHINAHIIMVSKLKCCVSKVTRIINREIMIERRFENLFPTEDILFTSKEGLIEIKSPILEI